MSSLSALWPGLHYLLYSPRRLTFARYLYTPVGPERLAESLAVPLNGQDSLGSALEQVCQRGSTGTDDTWHLGLPLSYFTFVDFSLPTAALEDLDSAVRFSLMRHVPYDVDSVYLQYGTRMSEDQVDVSAVLCPKDPVQPLLNAVRKAGVTVSSMFPTLVLVARLGGKPGIYASMGRGATEGLAWNDGRVLASVWDNSADLRAGQEFMHRNRSVLNNAPLPSKSAAVVWDTDISADEAAQTLGTAPGNAEVLRELPAGASKVPSSWGYFINLVPHSVLRKRRVSNLVLAASLAVLLAALLALPAAHLAGKQARLAEVEKRIEAIKPQADKLAGLRAENQRILKDIKAIAAITDKAGTAADALREVTVLLPDTASLNNFSYKQNQVNMRGMAANATEILTTLEKSALFREVRFTASLTKRGNDEYFRIETVFEPSSEAKQENQ